MKNLLIALLLIYCTCGYSQNIQRAVVPEKARNTGIEQNRYGTLPKVADHVRKITPLPKAGYLIDEMEIGETRYDKQTNHSNENRIFRYDDGTIGAVWMMGFSDQGDFPDRGTGYNYYDGTGWGSAPTNRLETMRCGWPSYSDFGPSGEIVVSHSTLAVIPGLAILKRTVKGSGSWNQSMLTGPPGHLEISWPRVVTSGSSNEVLHILATTDPVHNGGSIYMGLDGCPVYYRSNDGGTTWQVQYHLFPELDTSHYLEYSADCYAWAEPKGDTVAFVIGSKWTDLFVMKSVDGGLNWEKKLVFQHPYPRFDWTTTIIADTPTVCDGAIAMALDSYGKAHVFFGLMRVNHATVGDTYTFFPYTDGLAYWNEDMPAYTYLDADSLYNHGHLIGFCQDYNGNDSLDFIWGLEGLGEYVISLSGMPTVTIDDDDNIFVLYTSLMESFNSGTQNYRHLMGRASFDRGQTWVDTILDMTRGIVHNFDECIFPSLAPKSDDHIYYVYHVDEEPGLAISGDEDPYTDNRVICAFASKSDFGLSVPEHKLVVPLNLNIFPSPVIDYATLEFEMPKTMDIELEIVNIQGQCVFHKDLGAINAGYHRQVVETNALVPGMYFVKLRAPGSLASIKLIKY